MVMASNVVIGVSATTFDRSGDVQDYITIEAVFRSERASNVVMATGETIAWSSTQP